MEEEIIYQSPYMGEQIDEAIGWLLKHKGDMLFGGKLSPGVIVAPSDPTYWLAEEGTYTGAFPCVVPEGKMGVITYDGSEWSLSTYNLATGGEFATGEEVKEVGLFNDVSDLDGKTEEQKQAIIPNGVLVEEIATIREDLAATGYNNKIINEDGFVVQPTPGNPNSNVDVYDISQHAGKKVTFHSVNSSNLPYLWAVYTSTSVGTSATVRIMSEETSQGQAFTVTLDVQEGDKRLAVARYKSSTAYAYISDSVKNAVAANKQDIGRLAEDVEELDGKIENLEVESVLISNDNYSETPKSNYHYISFEDGEVAGSNNWGGSSGGKANYFVTGYIDIQGISRLRYRMPWSTSTVNAAVIAAYDDSQNYIAANSVKRVSGGSSGVWEKGETTRYVRFTVYYRNNTLAYYAIDPDTVGSQLAELKGDFDSLEEWAGNNINALNRDRDGIIANMKGNAATLGILHFTDLHYDPENMQRIMDWYNGHDRYIDCLLNTGDTVNSRYGTALGYGSVEGVEKILNVIGNHDIYDGSNYTHSGKDGYDAYFLNYISNWGVTQPTDAETEGKCYYYKDFLAQGIRLIVLDTIVAYTSGSAQQTWFKEVLADALTNGLTVVVACHWIDTTIDSVRNHFAPWNQFNENGSAGSKLVLADVQDFIDDGGEFACYLIGHSHADFIGTPTGYSQQLCIVCGSANGRDASDTYSVTHYGGEVRIPNTRSQDSFNVVGINASGHWIDIVKIGVDSNSYGQKKDFLRIDYKSMEEVFTNFSGSGSTSWEDIADRPTNVSAFTNDAGYLAQHQDITGKEDKTSVVSVESGTAALTAAVGTYYTIAGTVGTLAVTLPAVSDTTHLSSVVLFMTTGASPSLTLSSADATPIYYADNYSIEASSTYEINALFNGSAWVVACVKITTT